MAQKQYTASVTGAIAGPLDAGAGNTFRQYGLRVISPAAGSGLAPRDVSGCRVGTSRISPRVPGRPVSRSIISGVTLASTLSI